MKLALGICVPLLAGGLILSTAGGAYAAAGTPSTASTSAESVLVGQLSPSQRAVFEHLGKQDKQRVIQAFSDPRIALGTLTNSEAKSLYPGMTVVDQHSSGRIAGTSAMTTNSVVAGGRVTPSYTTYNVHSWFHHTVCYIGICNTASLDYYYVTGNNVVLSDQNCTWQDTGVSILVAITNITTSRWVTGGRGYCDATVQLADATRAIFTGVLYQNMVVNGPGIVSTYFHQDGP